MTSPPRKLDAVLNAMHSEQWELAIKLAAKFPRLGTHSKAIKQANEAILRPAFQRQLGRDPTQLIAAGKAAIVERYGDAK